MLIGTALGFSNLATVRGVVDEHDDDICLLAARRTR